MIGDRLRAIESAQNPQFKIWESLLDSRGLKRHRRFLLAGRKTVPEALARHPGRFNALLVQDAESIAGWRVPPAMPIYQLGRPLFDRLDTAGTGFPLLVGDVPDMPEVDLSRPPVGLELVCGLGDPNNLGALLRSAAAFGAGRVILMAEAAHPFHPKCLRAAANAQFELELLTGPAWGAFNEAVGPVVALDAGGDDLARFEWPRNVRLILGEEGQGLPPELKVRRLGISTTGAVESLNATVAASLALFTYHVSAD